MSDKSIVVLLKVDKVTKRTHRYAEEACKVNGEDDPGPAIRNIYVMTDLMKELNGGTVPEWVQVTIVPHTSIEEV